MNKKLFPVAIAMYRVANWRPCKTTIWRWKYKGCFGVKLQTTFARGRDMCTEADARQFLRDRTLARRGQPIAARTNRQLQADVNRAERGLKRFGI